MSREPQITRIVSGFFKKGYPDESEIQHSIEVISQDGDQTVWYFRKRITDALENTYKLLSQTFLGSYRPN